MANKTQVSKDFFTQADRMSLTTFEKFLTEVYLRLDPRTAPPLIVWGCPGVGKSEIINAAFKQVNPGNRGLKTVILSQIGALDTYGMPHINDAGTTEFTPTATFGRGQKHLFLDEMNNATPLVQGAVQNLLSAKVMGDDSYQDVFLIAACNPPSTNSLANDLNHPIMSRCMHIVMDYEVADFENFAMNIYPIHPAITAFHKQSEGTCLQAKFTLLANKNLEVPEPAQNEPFPTPRSWKIASDMLYALTKNGTTIPDWEMLRASIQGCVGIIAAEKFSQTYAYMNQIPDIKAIWEGKKVNCERLKNSTVVQYITMYSVINYAVARMVEASAQKIRFDLKSVKDRTTTDCYKLIAGVHRSIVFLGDHTTPELAQTALSSVWGRAITIENIGTRLTSELLQGVDPANGLTRESIIKYSRQENHNHAALQKALGQ